MQGKERMRIGKGDISFQKLQYLKNMYCHRIFYETLTAFTVIYQ